MLQSAAISGRSIDVLTAATASTYSKKPPRWLVSRYYHRYPDGEGGVDLMEELGIAVLGGVIVLAVQATVVLLRQWRHHVNAGQVQASRLYVGLRKLVTLPHKRGLVKKLRHAAEAQQSSIQTQYAKDPMWRLGQLRLVPLKKDEIENVQRMTLQAALEMHAAADGIFVRGESGSGKSSTSALTAIKWIKTPLALRVDLSSFRAEEPLLEQAGDGWLAAKDLERGLALGLVAFIFDGYESLQEESDRMAFDGGVSAIRRRYPRVPFAVLSRPENPPTRTLLKCTEYTLSALSDHDVEDAIRSLGIQPRVVLNEMDDSVKALCTSPLVLRMVLQAYSDHGVVSGNRAVLYREFVDALIRERPEPNYAMATISASVKLELLGELAWHCDNRLTTLQYPVAQRIIQPKLVELVSKYLIPATVDTSEVLRELVADGILRTDNRELRFVHYSVQEFLTAVALNNRLARADITLDDVSGLSTRREWRNSIIFLSGLLSDSTDLCDRLRLSNRVLAAECIQTAVSVKPTFVDKCIVEALYEFKFGKMSFNYDVVFALMLIANRCSNDIPERIVTEMGYWCRKYATRPYSELDGIDESSLISLLNTGEITPQVMNAIWTLGSRQSIEAVPYLERFLKDRVDPLDHVSALALGRSKSRHSAQLLLSTALDPSALDHLRSSCFNSIGMIAAKECLPAIAEFIRSEAELQGTIRENAAWALIGLVDDYLIKDKDFQNLLIDQLAVGTRYARAMFAYLIGRFQIEPGLDRLLGYANDLAEDPLFLEDVVFAIGEFHDDKALDTLRRLLDHPDNIVRARTVEAIAKLPSFDKTELLKYAEADEPSEIVRDCARTLLGLPDPDSVAMPEPPSVSSDVRRRR